MPKALSQTIREIKMDLEAMRNSNINGFNGTNKATCLLLRKYSKRQSQNENLPDDIIACFKQASMNVPESRDLILNDEQGMRYIYELLKLVREHS